MKTRQELKMRAKSAMRDQRSTAILLLLVLVLKVLALAVFDAIVLRKLGWTPSLLVHWAVVLALLVLAVGMTGEYIKIYRREPTHVMALYTDFKTRFWRKLGGMLWMLLWILLWALISVPVILLALFLIRRTGRGMRLLALVLIGPLHLAALVPAIIKSLSYFMTPYLLADCPDVTARQALKRSMQMMDGHKKELFVMVLSFIGWMLLSALTLGILYIVYVGPYMYTAYAGFYEELEVAAVEGAEIEIEEEIDSE